MTSTDSCEPQQATTPFSIDFKGIEDYTITPEIENQITALEETATKMLGFLIGIDAEKNANIAKIQEVMVFSEFNSARQHNIQEYYIQPLNECSENIKETLASVQNKVNIIVSALQYMREHFSKPSIEGCFKSIADLQNSPQQYTHVRKDRTDIENLLLYYRRYDYTITRFNDKVIDESPEDMSSYLLTSINGKPTDPNYTAEKSWHCSDLKTQHTNLTEELPKQLHTSVQTLINQIKSDSEDKELMRPSELVSPDDSDSDSDPDSVPNTPTPHTPGAMPTASVGSGSPTNFALQEPDQLPV